MKEREWEIEIGRDREIMILLFLLVSICHLTFQKYSPVTHRANLADLCLSIDHIFVE